jgi:hypothetical protein
VKEKKKGETFPAASMSDRITIIFSPLLKF